MAEEMEIKFLAGKVKWRRSLGRLRLRWVNIIQTKQNWLDIRV